MLISTGNYTRKAYPWSTSQCNVNLKHKATDFLFLIPILFSSKYISLFLRGKDCNLKEKKKECVKEHFLKTKTV